MKWNVFNTTAIKLGNILKTPTKEFIDEIFQGLNLDYSEFNESSEMAIFIASFIAINVKKTTPLKLVHHSWNSHHSLSVVGSEELFVTFRSSVGQYDLTNVYCGDELIVETFEQNLAFYYFRELIKNVTFCNYLIKDDQSYMNAIIFTDKDISEKLGVYSHDDTNLNFGIPSIEETGIVYRFLPYSIFVTVKFTINEYQFCFSGGLNTPHGFKTEAIYFKTFHELVCYINKYIYDNVVKTIINVPANEFTIRHKTLIQMVEI